MRMTTTATQARTRPNPRPRRAPKPVSRVDGAGLPMLEDTGCTYAPRCLACPWRACILHLPADERRIFSLAWRTLEAFKAPPDLAIDVDRPAGRSGQGR